MHDSSENAPEQHFMRDFERMKTNFLFTNVGAAKREMDEVASVVDESEDTLDVQDVEDLRALSESMYEGLATIRETHENEESRLPAFFVTLTQLSVRDSLPRAALAAEKGRQDLKEGLSIRKKTRNSLF